MYFLFIYCTCYICLRLFSPVQVQANHPLLYHLLLHRPRTTCSSTTHFITVLASICINILKSVPWSDIMSMWNDNNCMCYYQWFDIWWLFIKTYSQSNPRVEHTFKHISISLSRLPGTRLVWWCAHLYQDFRFHGQLHRPFVMILGETYWATYLPLTSRNAGMSWRWEWW